MYCENKKNIYNCTHEYETNTKQIQKKYYETLELAKRGAL